ncbi:DUF732 domain-containing protein [Streptomyces mirabilis]|uniref:DUF732 domain-containing protein n=1 Tax=Streptomyces TaxID=1883 RepID=UPI000BCCBB4F|nr:DUF732 domain-containing protein [Streptomyces sp. OK228]SOE24779.1 hypothetical protein SAMN05442782_1427 [Streptomyces sp. OK228]
MRLKTSLLIAVLCASVLSGCSEEEAYPGPIPSEEGHTYSPEQGAYLNAVRDLNWPTGMTEKDALFAALAVCGEEKDGNSDPAWLAHKVSEDFGLEAADAVQVVTTADVVFCIPLNHPSTP